MVDWNLFFIIAGFVLVYAAIHIVDPGPNRDKPHTFEPAKIPKWANKLNDAVDYLGKITSKKN